jgi:mannosyltransferase
MDIRQKRITIVSLLLILLLALVLRFYRLGAQSLWNDEGTSVALAQRDLATIARDAAHDIHPPLYYWLLSGWVRLVGTGEAAVRSLSALLGVALVALTYALGRLLAGRWAGLAAAVLAAINPFQVYYSQEARMYMLLAVLGALAFFAALRWIAARPGEGLYRWGILYVLAGAAGLYTHYAFPMVLAAINLVVLLDFGLRWGERRWWGRLGGWVGLQVGVALLFAPWLPTAYRQLTTWPGAAETVDLVAAFTRICQLLSTGPAAPPWKETGWVLLLLLLAFYPGRRSDRLPGVVAYLAPVLWLAVPIALIFGGGLFKEAYLKFLLVVSPAFCLLAGRLVTAPCRGRQRALSFAETFICAFVAMLLAGASLHGLYQTYNNPAYARDDYRGIAAYIDAVGRSGDAVLLNAPGQQEVFGYYYDGNLPVYPLPASRPLDPVATKATLEELARPPGRVFAVLWATVRLAVYAVPERTPDEPDRMLNVRLQSPEVDDGITLLGYSLLSDRLAAGDIAQITLFWQADRVPTQRYKVFLHVLDEGNQIVGQRDAEPGGGARLTTLWERGEVVADNYGLPIHPATPPGEYRVEVGMYNPETGQRLITPDGESQVWLEPLKVDRPAVPAPAAALGMEHAEGADWGPLVLLGYDAHKLGFAHLPDLPLRPGDLLQVSLYWRAEAQPGGDWRVSIGLVDAGEREWAAITAEPVGGYPTSRWQEGDVWRGQFNLLLPADAPPGRIRLRVQAIAPDGTRPEPFLSGPLTVEH